MLQESTAKLWQTLSSKPELAGFVLIGGSALAKVYLSCKSEEMSYRDVIDRLHQAIPAEHFEEEWKKDRPSDFKLP